MCTTNQSAIKEPVLMETNKDIYPIKAAELLVKEFGTPAKFIDFLTQALRYAAVYEYQKPNTGRNREDYYFANDLIKEVALHWVNGGERVIETMASGLREAWEYYGHESYCEQVGNIIKAFGHAVEMMESRDDAAQFVLSCATLLKITDIAFDYEQESYKEKNKTSY